MSLGILGRSSLGDDASDATAADVALNAKYPWHAASRDTLALQQATNESLKAAGYCPVPVTGILDGSLCGARNHLTIHSREFFGADMLFANPPACKDPANAGELVQPTSGCFKPAPLKPDQKIGSTFSRSEWIMIGGVLSVALVGFVALKSSSAKGA